MLPSPVYSNRKWLKGGYCCHGVWTWKIMQNTKCKKILIDIIGCRNFWWPEVWNHHKGVIIFYREGGSVCDGRSSIFSGPPLRPRDKILVPPLTEHILHYLKKELRRRCKQILRKNFGLPPLWPSKILVPTFGLLKETGPLLWPPQKILVPPPSSKKW